MSQVQRLTRSASRRSLQSSSTRTDGMLAKSSPFQTVATSKKRVQKRSEAEPTAVTTPNTGTPGSLPSSEPFTPPKKKQKRTEIKSSLKIEDAQDNDESKLSFIAEQHIHKIGQRGSQLPPERPAEPRVTNATLKTPRGSRVVAYRAGTESSKDVQSPSNLTQIPGAEPHSKVKIINTRKSVPSSAATSAEISTASGTRTMPKPTTNTNRLLSDGIAHLLKMEPRLKPVIDAHHCHIFSPKGLAEPVDPFRALTSGILAQQVSGAAAAAIKRRFVLLFLPDDKKPESDTDSYLDSKGAFPTPEQVAKADIPQLRSAGLSQRKAEYVKGLAEKFTEGELSAQILVEASYEEILEKLIAVRGLGRWSVEMFACFGLKRMDVFSTGDLGVQRGMAAFAGRDVAKLKNKGGKWKYMSEQDMLDMSEKFSPYRTLFMWYMWRVEDVNVEALQNN